MPKTIGIDFGTAKTVVATIQGGKPRVVVNAEGSPLTPAVVTRTAEGQWLVGDPAKKRAVLEPNRTICSVKRFLGRRYTEVSEAAALVSYRLARGPQETVRIAVDDHLYAPEEIAARLLRTLVDDASATLGAPVEAAVIAVPSLFTPNQRQALLDASVIAGLRGVQLLHEPTAVAIAYSAARQRSATLLIFDLGSGGCQVSLVDVGGGVCEVRASTGTGSLGGDVFDSCLLNAVSEHWNIEPRIDLRANPQTRQRLWEAVERAKCELSSAKETTLQVPYLISGGTDQTHLNLKFTRDQLEALIAPQMRRCEEMVAQVLAEAKMSSTDIDEVLLVGGGARLPAVHALLRRMLGSPERMFVVQPDEVVAVGAAVQAEGQQGAGEKMLVFDVTPLSLNVITSDGMITTLVTHNTALPCRKTKIFSTVEDNQPVLELLIQQEGPGREARTQLISQVRLQGIRPAPRGVPQLEVTFDLDANGILSIRARDRDTGQVHEVLVHNSPNLEREEVARLQRDVARGVARRGSNPAHT